MLKRVQHDDGGGEGVRFRAGLAATGFEHGRLGLAVSGGPDSLALLLLAHEALPRRTAAATVDHGLRPEAASEAAFVADLCRTLDVPHAILTVSVQPGGAGVQGEARAARYAALAQWAAAEGLNAIATGHHADDQAETTLMRLARGSGLAGLSGVRRQTLFFSGTERETARAASGGGDYPQAIPGGESPLHHAPHGPPPRAGENLQIVRPLLDFRRTELAAIVARAGIAPVNDPSNADRRYDRTAARALLAETTWLDPTRLAASAAHLAEAEAGLDWAAGRAWAERADADGFDPVGLPAEIVRRLTLRMLALHGLHTPRGPEVARLIAALHRGENATLGGILARPARGRWHFALAPPRRPSPL